MSGFFTNGVCFPTQQQAIDTYYQMQSAFTGSDKNSAFIYKYVRAADGSWVLNRTDLNGAAAANLNLSALTFSTCESPNDTTTSFLNGVELGWAVASLIVIAFVLRRLRRGF